MLADYRNRLISLSWHYLSIKECHERMLADIQPGFQFAGAINPSEPRGLYDPADFAASACDDSSANLLDVLQIDALRPSFDYLDLKYPGALIFLMIDIECLLAEALRRRGHELNWFTLSCTTQDDTPISALRRTIIFPSRNLQGNPVEQLPRSADFPLKLLAEIEDEIESYILAEAPKQHYA